MNEKIAICYVDNDNIFLYKRIYYKINDEVKQYQTSESGDDMDNIFVIERDNHLIFMDGNTEKIESKFISPA
jgi:hypothetical protein